MGLGDVFRDLQGRVSSSGSTPGGSGGGAAAAANELFGSVFKKHLVDLIHGIRAHKKNEAKYINSAIQEIKRELRSDSPADMYRAVQKCTYLNMLGYQVGFCAFKTVMLMNQPRFAYKRVAYLCAAQVFNDDTEEATLCTQIVRKDMTGHSPYEAGLAINCLANIVTADLARDLAADMVALLNTSRPYVRKRCVLAMYKIFLKYPESLRPAFPRLREKLEDPDPGVQSAAVNVVCELARKNPKNYLGLAPALYRIMTNTHNNWMLIKVIKLFAALLPAEPRLARRLVEPLTNIINTTTAMSLLFEAIKTCTIGLINHAPTVRLCVSKLRLFLEDQDQNLKYLGLVALHNIMKVHPKAVAECKDVIIWCLDDTDLTIRQRALELLQGLITKRNLMEVVGHLIEKLPDAEPEFRDSLVKTIVEMCSNNAYQFVTDFEWYITVLVDLTRVSETQHGPLIAAQMMDTIIRVSVVREFGVDEMCNLLTDDRFFSDSPAARAMTDVLYAAAWVVGEFSEMVRQPGVVLNALLDSRVCQLPGNVQAVYLQNSLKLLGRLEPVVNDAAKFVAALRMFNERLPPFTLSPHAEVAERAVFIVEVLRCFLEAFEQVGPTAVPQLAAELRDLFSDPLKPVAPKAAAKAARQVPAGLDLDKVINPPDEDEEIDFEIDPIWSEGLSSNSNISMFGAGGTMGGTMGGGFGTGFGSGGSYQGGPSGSFGPAGAGAGMGYTPSQPVYMSEAEREAARSARQAANASNPYMLSGGGGGGGGFAGQGQGYGGGDLPQMQQLSAADLGLDGSGAPQQLVVRSHRYRAGSNSGRRSKKRGGRSGKGEAAGGKVTVMDVADVDGGSSSESGSDGEDNPLAGVVLDDIKQSETLYQPAHRKSSSARQASDPNMLGGGDDGSSRRRRSRRRHRKDGETEQQQQQQQQQQMADGSDPYAQPQQSQFAGGLSAALGDNGSGGDGKRRRRRRQADSGASSSPSASATAGNAASSPGFEQLVSPVGGSNGKSSSSKSSKHRRHRRHGHRSSSSSSRKTLSDVSGGATPVDDKVLLATDEAVALVGEVLVSAAESSKVVIAVSVGNRGSSPVSVQKIEFQPVGDSFKLLQTGPCGQTVPPTSSIKHQAMFEFAALSSAQTLPGTVSYRLENSGVDVQLPFVMPVPSSAYVLPVGLDKEQFIAVMRSPEAASFTSSEAVVDTAGPVDLKLAVETVCRRLHLTTVALDPAAGTAALYGRSVQGHHVAVLCKVKSGGAGVAFEFKVSDAVLAGSLAGEAMALQL